MRTHGDASTSRSLRIPWESGWMLSNRGRLEIFFRLSHQTVWEVNAGRADEDICLKLSHKDGGFCHLFPRCQKGPVSSGKSVTLQLEHWRVAVAVCTWCPIQNRGIRLPLMSFSILYKFHRQTGIRAHRWFSWREDVTGLVWASGNVGCVGCAPY